MLHRDLNHQPVSTGSIHWYQFSLCLTIRLLMPRVCFAKQWRGRRHSVRTATKESMGRSRQSWTVWEDRNGPKSVSRKNDANNVAGNFCSSVIWCKNGNSGNKVESLALPDNKLLINIIYYIIRIISPLYWMGWTTTECLFFKFGVHC